jgi:molybdate transport system ATP-binding protein
MNTNISSDYLQVAMLQTGPIPLNVRFSCQQHELIVLVGPSGSGKTTILRAIAGLYNPLHSRVSCDGEIWTDNSQKIYQPAQKRRTGLVFQHYALFPHLNVFRNIELACGQIPDNKKQEYVLEMLHLVNMDGLELRYPAQLSGGQQQRVALARALARQPSILLLDEPFSAVDQVTRRKLRRELARLRQKLNIPIFLVTHDLDEARMLADRMYILHNGTLLQDGTPTEILSKPANALVARLVDLGNLFSGKIIRHDPANNLTYLAWGSMELECSLREEYPPDTVVDWVIPPESIILHRRDRPSRGERENPVHGVIEQSIPLGENTSILMKLDKETTMSFSIPTHTARRNNLLEGEEINVSLLAEAIHLMPRNNINHETSLDY